MEPATDNLLLAQRARELRDTWQGRALTGIKGPFRAVLMSVLAHNFEGAIYTLCAVVDPNFDGSIPAPHLTSAAKIAKTGAVVADVVDRFGNIKEKVIFASEGQMRDAFRALADTLKLPDNERIELFRCAQRWVVADRRLDPNMDPQDPDARRLH